MKNTAIKQTTLSLETPKLSTFIINYDENHRKGLDSTRPSTLFNGTFSSKSRSSSRNNKNSGSPGPNVISTRKSQSPQNILKNIASGYKIKTPIQVQLNKVQTQNTIISQKLSYEPSHSAKSSIGIKRKDQANSTRKSRKRVYLY